jgi:hypothetical protein
VNPGLGASASIPCRSLRLGWIFSIAKQAGFGAAANSDLRRTGVARYRTTTAGKYQVSKEGWTSITETDLQPASKAASYSEAEQSLDKLKLENPAKAAVLKIARSRRYL